MRATYQLDFRLFTYRPVRKPHFCVPNGTRASRNPYKRYHQKKQIERNSELHEKLSTHHDLQDKSSLLQ